MAALLQFVASVTSRKPLLSLAIAESLQLPDFTQGETLDGKITVVMETGDPTNPTEAFGLDDANRVALTDGISVLYAEGLSLTIENKNEVTFQLLVDSPELQAALADTEDDGIAAFFEVRITKDDQ